MPASGRYVRLNGNEVLFDRSVSIKFTQYGRYQQSNKTTHVIGYLGCLIIYITD